MTINFSHSLTTEYSRLTRKIVDNSKTAFIPKFARFHLLTRNRRIGDRLKIRPAFVYTTTTFTRV